MATARSTGSLKWAGGLAALVAAALTALSLLGLLPWTTQREFIDHKAADAATFSREDRKLDEIHEDLRSLLFKSGLPHRHDDGS